MFHFHWLYKTSTLMKIILEEKHKTYIWAKNIAFLWCILSVSPENNT